MCLTSPFTKSEDPGKSQKGVSLGVPVHDSHSLIQVILRYPLRTHFLSVNAVKFLGALLKRAVSNPKLHPMLCHRRSNSFAMDTAESGRTKR